MTASESNHKGTFIIAELTFCFFNWLTFRIDASASVSNISCRFIKMSSLNFLWSWQKVFHFTTLKYFLK